MHLTNAPLFVRANDSLLFGGSEESLFSSTALVYLAAFSLDFSENKILVKATMKGWKAGGKADNGALSKRLSSSDFEGHFAETNNSLSTVRALGKFAAAGRRHRAANKANNGGREETINNGDQQPQQQQQLQHPQSSRLSLTG